MSGPTTNQDVDRSPSNGHAELLYVVGIGASAGGLEALERLFKKLPADTGMAFVIVQHLSPDFDSVMDELLVRQTKMPIRTVEDGIDIKPNAIYLIPPKKEMIISGGRLLLTDKDPKQGLTLPIDTFFRSLAQDCGARSVGVILSGTGSDGSRGIRDIHAAGGMVLVQTEESAKFDGMPKSAQETGVVDLVLSPEHIAETLEKYAKSPIISQLVDPTETPPINEDGMNRVTRLLRNAYGIDFSLYKPTTVTRRIERRLLLNQSLDFDDYVAQLESNPQELNLLYHDLLIGVTQFFRDRDAFELIEKQVLPELLQKLPRDEELRIWVAGCATGEEAYSLAILVNEQIAALGRKSSAKIFATDVHQSSLDIASAGIYPESALAGVSAARRQKYFSRKGKNYQVHQELRQMVVFAQHNVIKDAPFTRLDLVSCRNLLIYLQPVVQKKIISLFHFGLKTGGLLFLGPSEGVGDLSDEFKSLDHHWKIYRKLRDVKLTTDLRLPMANLGLRVPHVPSLTSNHSHNGQLDAAYREIMELFAPPSVLINQRRQVVHVFGGAADYLHIKPGPTSNDILDLFDADLRTAVSGAIQRAKKENAKIAYTGVTFTRNDERRQLKLSVQPLAAEQHESGYMLITLEELKAPSQVEEPEEIDVGEVSRDRIAHLESELRHTKENLQTTIEELETSNEELHATNEELVASNEELQSTNEELHSVNEELYTVNAEYQRKITELTELTEDMDNLLASTDVGVLFLDKDLCIRKFTPRVAGLLNIVEQDIGRAFEHFTHNLQHDSLMKDVQWVLTTGMPFEKETQDRSGHWHFLRLLPYQSKANVDGVVLTLIDIDSIKQAEVELHGKQQQLQGVLDNSPAFVYVKDLEGRYIMVNRRCRRVLDRKPEEVLGKTDYEFLPRAVADRLASRDRAVRAGGKEVEIEEVIPRKGKGRTYLASLYPLRDDSGRIISTAGILTDITRQKLAQHRAKEAVRHRDQFLAMLSHELRNPLAAISGATELLQTRNVQDGELKQVCDVIRRQSEQTSRLLDDLLDVSRVARGKVELRKEVVDLRDTASAAVEAARSVIAQHQHKLEVDIADEPLWIEGDAARLQQIQVNLLVNAAKYTPDGGNIKLRLAADDGKAFIFVTDTGVGMTADFQKKVFDPFVQCKRTLARSDGGLGLGLTLVRTLVEMHDGEVEAHSDGKGQGSTFTAWLPMTTKSSQRKTESERGSEQTADTTSLKLLVVEDNADVREMTRMLLELHGYDVLTASDGLAGLTAIEVEKPDVALVDIGLPELDGYELARRVREKHDDVYLIALTGYGQQSDREQTAKAGFNDHLTKPVNFDHLRSRLQDVARQRDGESVHILVDGRKEESP
ncbi:MAG: PAS domain-containing protein [Planctomycetaceae bacterium]|nr:PAS domain-containing protein [Planctomycetaceae bacterium]